MNYISRTAEARRSIERLLGLFLLFGLLFLISGARPSFAGPASKCYPDGHGGKVCFPLGDDSFADEVVNFTVGKPAPERADHRNPKYILGKPDYKRSSDSRFLSLGCGGTVTLRFVDNMLVDLPGPDLFVFELGGAKEPMVLEISDDGKSWIKIGRIWGARAAVDISWAIEPGQTFQFVRIRDLKYGCDIGVPGADIDAIGAIGSGTRITLSSSVLFDVGSDALKARADKELKGLIKSVAVTETKSMIVEGHTDSDGSDSSNLDLSKRRAAAVEKRMQQLGGLPERIKISTRGHGETKPVADNASAAGREKNRRVEITLIPPTDGKPAKVSNQSLAASARPGFSGKWKSDNGDINFIEHSDGRVLGTYSIDNGRIQSKSTGRELTGYWIEDKSSRKCATTKDGRFYWGRFKAQFDEDFVRFKGKWAYCDNKKWGGNWNGRWNGE